MAINPSAIFSTMRGPEGWWMDHGMMYWGAGWLMMMIFMIIFWILVVIALVYFIRWMIGQKRTGFAQKPEDTALEILKRRYARGDIGKEEFEEKKRDLS